MHLIVVIHHIKKVKIRKEDDNLLPICLHVKLSTLQSCIF